jgi:septal ring factor EnvC (AmiA/AmiB activator)
LGRALKQNTFITKEVAQSAGEMLLINTVLKQEIQPAIQTGDVQQALLQSDALEDKLVQTAQNLAQVNQTLNEEITQRVKLERELNTAKAASKQAGSKPPQV